MDTGSETSFGRGSTCPTAIVAGIHPLIVFLLKIGVQWQHPVRAFLVGTTLVRPESWRGRAVLRAHRVRIVGPTLDRQLGCPAVAVLDIEKRHRRKVVVYGDGDRFLQPPCLSLDREPLALAESIFCSLMFLRGQEKSAPKLAG